MGVGARLNPSLLDTSSFIFWLALAPAFAKAAAKKAHTASKEAHADTPDFHAIDKPTQSKFKLRKTH